MLKEKNPATKQLELPSTFLPSASTHKLVITALCETGISDLSAMIFYSLKVVAAI